MCAHFEIFEIFSVIWVSASVKNQQRHVTEKDFVDQEKDIINPESKYYTGSNSSRIPSCVNNLLMPPPRSAPFKPPPRRDFTHSRKAIKRTR